MSVGKKNNNDAFNGSAGLTRTLQDIKTRIKEGQYKALKVVNDELIKLYWDLGKMLSIAKSQANWGDGFIDVVASEIQIDNPGIKGFSKSNLFSMIKFYESYKDKKIFQPLVGKITWTHNIIILDKCRNDLEREYYIKMASRYGWSKRVLLNKIEFDDYRNTFSNQNNFKDTLPSIHQDQAKLAIRDTYIFDLLELGDQHSERELENAILQNIEKFLKDMNNEFLFVGRQFRIEISNKEYFLDLLLYHRLLKCFVAIDLKIGDFEPEYAGKMSFYLSALDEKLKTQEENKSIGIIICKNKDRTVVEYALRDSKKPMAVSTYARHKELPKEYARYLPDEVEISRRLTGIDNKKVNI